MAETERDTPQGPVDPHGPGGIDAPVTDRGDRDLQEENAETSLNQPST